MNSKMMELEIARRELESQIAQGAAQAFHPQTSFWNQVIEKVYLMRVSKKIKKTIQSKNEKTAKRSA